MGGVDTGDQYRQNYHVLKSGTNTFFGFLFVYIFSHNTSCTPNKTFREQLPRELISAVNVSLLLTQLFTMF